jgi:hypothetical protein
VISGVIGRYSRQENAQVSGAEWEAYRLPRFHPQAGPSSAWHANPGTIFEAPVRREVLDLDNHGLAHRHHPCLEFPTAQKKSCRSSCHSSATDPKVIRFCSVFSARIDAAPGTRTPQDLGTHRASTLLRDEGFPCWLLIWQPTRF